MIHNSSGSKAQSAQRRHPLWNANPPKIPQEPEQTFTFDHFAFRPLAQLWSYLVSPVDVFVNCKQKCNELSMSLQSLISSKAELTELISLNKEGSYYFTMQFNFHEIKANKHPSKYAKFCKLHLSLLLFRIQFKPMNLNSVISNSWSFISTWNHFPQICPSVMFFWLLCTPANLNYFFVSPQVQHSRVHVQVALFWNET